MNVLMNVTECYYTMIDEAWQGNFVGPQQLINEMENLAHQFSSVAG